MEPDKQLLLSLVKTEVPFGKFKGVLLYQLNISYLEWFKRQGFPKGRLGMQLETVYEIKLNGLDELFAGLKNIS